MIYGIIIIHEKEAMFLNIRQTIEQKEIKTLSEFAAKSAYSKGRDIEEKEDDMKGVIKKYGF